MNERHHAPGLIDEPPMLVYPTLARILGINKAVVLQQTHFLLNGQKTAKNQYTFVDGRWWVYNSYSEWHEFFPWLTERTIRTIFLELESNEKVVISRQGVKNPSDRRKWYTIDYEAWDQFYLTMGQKISHLPWDKKYPIMGQKISDDSSKTPSESTETPSDTFPAPVGAEGETTPPDEKPAQKPREKKPRERNVMFDAVADAFGIDDPNAEGGRIGMISSWLEGKSEGRGARKVGFISAPATPEHIKLFFSEWPKTHKGVHPPMDFVSFVEHWRIWASSKRRAPQTPAAPPTTPVASVPLDDPMDEAEIQAYLAEVASKGITDPAAMDAWRADYRARLSKEVNAS